MSIHFNFRKLKKSATPFVERLQCGGKTYEIIEQKSQTIPKIAEIHRELRRNIREYLDLNVKINVEIFQI